MADALFAWVAMIGMIVFICLLFRALWRMGSK